MFSDVFQCSDDGFWDSWGNWQMFSLQTYKFIFNFIPEFIQTWKTKVTYGSLESMFIGNIVDCVCFTISWNEFVWTLVGNWGFLSNLFCGTGSFTNDSMWCFIGIFESSWMNFRVWTNNGGGLVSNLICSNECDDCEEYDGLQFAHIQKKIVLFFWSN